MYCDLDHFYEMEGYVLLNPRGVVHYIDEEDEDSTLCGRKSWTGIYCHDSCSYIDDNDSEYDPPSCSSGCPLVTAQMKNLKTCKSCVKKETKEYKGWAWKWPRAKYIPKHKPGMIDSLSKTIDWLDALGLRR